LASIGFWASVGQPAPSRAQVAGVAGYSPGSGGFNNLIGALRSAGMISIPSSGRVSLADGAPSEGLSRDEAADRLRSVLTNPQAKLVDAAMQHPQMTREELAAATGYAPKSGGFNNLIGSLCTLTVFEKPASGCIAVSDWVREVLG